MHFCGESGLTYYCADEIEVEARAVVPVAGEHAADCYPFGLRGFVGLGAHGSRHQCFIVQGSGDLIENVFDSSIFFATETC